MSVNSLNDVMSYFGFAFAAYVALSTIVIINFCKALYMRKKLHEHRYNMKSIQRIDLVIDVLCGIGMVAGLMFQGVLADNNALGHETWFNILLGITIVSFIIFLLNLVVVVKERK